MEGGLMALVNSVEYNNYKIREWNITQFAKLTNTLGAIAEEYEKKQIKFVELSDLLEATAQDGALGLSKSALTFLSPILSRSEDILRVSLGLTPVQLEEIKFSDGVVLVLLILKTNLSHLSNFFLSLVESHSPATTA